MEKTIYKRVRLGGILLCLALIAVCIIPVSAFAADTASTEEDSVHFINPTAITVVGDCLYVADVVEDGKTALLCFDIAKDSPTLEYTFELDGKISGLSNDGDKRLFAICKNTVVELEIKTPAALAVSKTYSNFDDKNDVEIVDFAYGYEVKSTTEKNFYAITNNSVLQYNAEQNKFIQFASLNGYNGTAGCLAVNDVNAPYLYYLHDDTCDRYDLKSNKEDTDFKNKLQLKGVVPAGMFRLLNKIALYDNSNIYVVEESSLHVDVINRLSLSNLYKTDCKIVDIDCHGERLFVLNSKNKIDIFEKGDIDYAATPTYTIGSDIVDKTVPSEYTSFTLVRPNGYPANIVYKTNADTSVADIITDAEEYIVLGYDGDETSHYYYVLVGDKFGWVKKSDGATTPKEDDKLTVVDNNRSDETYTQEAKFTSLNGVFVYELPLSNAKYEKVTQTASTMKTVKILQEYKEGDTVWYYVSYDENKYGFVKTSDVGQIHIKSSDEYTGDAVELKKINSSLFAAVNLYATAEMREKDFVADDDGNTIKLYSGDRVTLIKTENDAAFVMILHNDNSRDFGWLPTNRLIGVHQITTNAIVGISLLAAAIVLAAVLLIVYFKRKKKIKRNSD